MKTRTIATETQVRARLAAEGTFALYPKQGERAWDPGAARGWTRGAGRIVYRPPSSAGFIGADWTTERNEHGSDLHAYDYDRRTA